MLTIGGREITLSWWIDWWPYHFISRILGIYNVCGARNLRK